MRLPRRRTPVRSRRGRVPSRTPTRRQRLTRAPVTRSAPAPPTPEPPPLRRATLTGRAAIVAVAVCAVVLSLAYPLQEFLAQRNEIRDVRAQNAAARLRVAALEEQRQRWSDPAYVKAQARSRLHMVMPGEMAFVVLRPRATASAATRGRPADPAQPWYTRLWTSVEDAGRSPRR